MENGDRNKMIAALADLFKDLRGLGSPATIGEIKRRTTWAARVLAGGGVELGGRRLENVYTAWAVDPVGRILWQDWIVNLVVNAGLDDSLDKHLKGSAYTAAWYMLLTDGTPTVAAADTMASHAGWVEVTAYTEANRPTITWGTVSGQSVDNSGAVAVFSVNAPATTIGGAGVTSNNTKGGSTGILYGAGAFTGGDKVLGSGDTLNATVTATAAAS